MGSRQKRFFALQLESPAARVSMCDLGTNVCYINAYANVSLGARDPQFGLYIYPYFVYLSSEGGVFLALQFSNQLWQVILGQHMRFGYKYALFKRVC